MESTKQPVIPSETVCTNCSKADIHRKNHRIPEILFEDQRLTSFTGLVLYQALFSLIDLKPQINACFRHLKVSPNFGHVVVLLLIVHLLLGFRRLQDMRFYRNGPMVLRLLGLRRLPDVATLSRTLARLDECSVANLRHLSRQRVPAQLAELGLPRVTLDFDGSVLSIDPERRSPDMDHRDSSLSACTQIPPSDPSCCITSLPFSVPHEHITARIYAMIGLILRGSPHAHSRAGARHLS